jgi:histidyl-tRNA synthetase
MRERTWLFDKFREVARVFSFQEYDAPVLEYEELYTRFVPSCPLNRFVGCRSPPFWPPRLNRKAGEEITQQMYNFVDKGDQKVSLRPEMTPSLARLVIQKVRAPSVLDDSRRSAHQLTSWLSSLPTPPPPISRARR